MHYYHQYGDLLVVYLSNVRDIRGAIALLAVVPAVLGFLWSRVPSLHGLTARQNRTIERFAAGAVVFLGLYLAVANASIVDDAFISFRYARNLAEGHGLVFNFGDRVEGYTNFLWTLLIAILLRLQTLPAPAVALSLSLLCFVANLLVVAAFSEAFVRPGDSRLRLPLAVFLLAVQETFYEFATSGMETMAVSLLVNLGLYLLVIRPTPRRLFGSGLCFVLATLMRPDAFIFHVVAAFTALASGRLPGLFRVEAEEVAQPYGQGGLLCFAAPAALYPLYAVGKLAYYGSLLPATFYAKSVGDLYVSQGLFYAASFYLGAHFWVAALLILTWVFRPAATPQAARFRVFAVGAIAWHTFYVVSVGGDFMYGRFLVVVAPLLLLAAEEAVYSLPHRRTGKGVWRAPWARYAAAGLLLATAHGAAPLAACERGHVADNCQGYRIGFDGLRQLFFADPGELSINDARSRGPVFLRRLFVNRGLSPTVAAAGIGRLGYYSHLRVVDIHGLTDIAISRRALAARSGFVGHEKTALLADLIARRTHFVYNVPYQPRERESLTRLQIPGYNSNTWEIVIYERNLMRAIRRISPEVEFVDFEAYLDRYLTLLPGTNRDEAARDYAWFRSFYFDHNADAERQAAFEKYFQKTSI